MGWRVGVWVLVVVSAAAVAVAGWIAARPDGEASFASADLVGGALGLAWVLTGAVLVTLRSRNLLGWLLLGIGACEACQVVLSAYGSYGVAVADPMWPAARWAAFAASSLYIPVVLAPPTLLLALYSNGRLAGRWWRWPVGGASAGIAVATLLVPFAPSAYDDIAPGPPPLSLAEGPLLFALAVVCVPLLVSSTVAIWIGTIVRLLRARYPERQQLAWLTCVVMPFLVATFVGPRWGNVVVGFLLPLAVAVGVLLVPAARRRDGSASRLGLRDADRRGGGPLPDYRGGGGHGA